MYSKLSYCCTRNLGRIIKGSNVRTSSIEMNQWCDDTAVCNYRIKNKCPLNGKCSAGDVVYCAKVESSYGNTMAYINCTEGQFKKKVQTTIFPISKY